MDKLLLNKLIGTLQKQAPSLSVGTKIDTRLSAYIERYEKLRNIVGFQEESVWRRYAIERIIKRKLFFSVQRTLKVQDLIEELVLSNYISERQVTAETVTRIASIIKNYVNAYEAFKPNGNHTAKNEIQRWFLGIMAVEIEDELALLDHDHALVECMVKELSDRLVFSLSQFRDRDRDILLLMAGCHALLKAKHEVVAYFIIKRRHPEWLKNDSYSTSQTDEMWTLRGMLARYEKSSFYNQLIRVVKPYSVVFTVFDEVLKKHQGNLDLLREKTRTVIHEIYNTLQRKVKRQLLHSFVYLLLTKLILVFVIEIPYDLWQYGFLRYAQVGINIAAPILLLFILTIGIRVGSEANTSLLIEEVYKLMTGDKSNLESSVKPHLERSLSRMVLFKILLILGYGATYGGMIYMLLRYNFSLVGGFFFVLFITLVTYLAVRIRFVTERFQIVDERGSFGREILYFFALPMLISGKWVVQRFSKYNVILLIFDLLFEAPYKTLVFLFRDFSDYAEEERRRIE
jgi:hypothetical protein